MAKTRVAVFFGGRSPEHDVSIVTGLQVLDALDSQTYEAIPVYVSMSGEWFLGEELRSRDSYIPGAEARRRLTACRLGQTSGGAGQLLPEKKGLFGSAAPIAFDVAIPAFHGAFGEDGCFQGLMELADIAYTGLRVLGSAVAMDKAQTKAVVGAETDVPQLPFVSARKIAGMAISAPELPQGWSYPVIVKPAHMGSSIGVARADSAEEVEGILQTIFLYDSKAIIEPFIAQRREYNIAVRRHQGALRSSAIEMPKSTAELLDFKEKYGGGAGGKKGGQPSEGMLSLTRDINPAMAPEAEANLRRWAGAIFEALDGTGAPRLDFIVNTETDEVWFNEINPCPGSFGYFLWEASADKLLFGELLDQMIAEAIAQKQLTEMPVDPVPGDARLFERKV